VSLTLARVLTTVPKHLIEAAGRKRRPTRRAADADETAPRWCRSTVPLASAAG